MLIILIVIFNKIKFFISEIIICENLVKHKYFSNIIKTFN